MAGSRISTCQSYALRGECKMTSTTKNMSAISRSGKHGMKKTARCGGKVHGDKAGLVGTLSAAQWQRNFSVSRSTSTVAVLTISFHIMKRRSHRQRDAPARSLSAIGSTVNISWLTGKKCPSHSAIFTPCGTSLRKATPDEKFVML